jgi:hypothetical protein
MRRTEMTNVAEIGALERNVTRLRERARHARHLAEEVLDRFASVGLREHAAELERQAQEVEARIAVFKAAERPAELPQDMAALKPPLGS